MPFPSHPTNSSRRVAMLCFLLCHQFQISHALSNLNPRIATSALHANSDVSSSEAERIPHPIPTIDSADLETGESPIFTSSRDSLSFHPAKNGGRRRFLAMSSLTLLCGIGLTERAADAVDATNSAMMTNSLTNQNTSPTTITSTTSASSTSGSSSQSSASTSNAAATITVNKKIGGLANKIRGICLHMDELQRDLMQERWELVQTYPQQLRSYVPVFTTYTDAAFPSELPSDYGLRVALRYEVGRFFASLERFKRAVSRKSLDEAYVAYADMSLHLDRYLRVGGLYTYYDNTVDNEPLFQAYNDALVYADPAKDPAEVRDLIVLCKGPDKGKTGIVIGIYPDGNNDCVVKLDKFRGMREIRVVPRAWAAKRLGEQDPDEVFLIPRKGAKA